MKFIYILGLEHSGSTLTNHLLSRLPDSIGIGEATQFFSPKHMKYYMNRWGEYDDVRVCSCLKDWSDCDFWSELEPINGLSSNIDIKGKYRQLFNYVIKKYSNDAVVVDSSKSLQTISMLCEQAEFFGLRDADIHIVFAVKDPREFAMSVIRKNQKKSLLSILRAFNWWYSTNQKIFDYCLERKHMVTISCYSELCNQPLEFLELVTKNANINHDVIDLTKNNSKSHIAMGNKNFVLRNSDVIRYDDEWRSVWQIHFIAFVHFSARKLYQKLRTK